LHADDAARRAPRETADATLVRDRDRPAARYESGTIHGIIPPARLAIAEPTRSNSQ